MPYVIVMLLLMLGGFGYGAKEYYDHSQEQIFTLKENQSKLEDVIKQKMLRWKSSKLI